MKYLSVCSGIEAATVAWEPIGFTPVGFSEIEQFPSAVLAHRFPAVKNYGDMTKYKEWNDVGKFDILVGGTPCQSFSIAGLRKGLDDPRGNLMLTYGAIADYFKPTWIVWENVPGVLSSNKGRDFGTFLGMLGQLGYGFAYRVLDAQYFGVPQRRRRVFVVGYLGDWRIASKVLFDTDCMRGNPPPSKEKGEGVAGTISARPTAGDGLGTDFELAGGLQVDRAMCFEQRSPDGCARLTGDISPTLTRMGGVQLEPCICLMDQGGSIMNVEYDISGTLRRETRGHEPIIMSTGQANAEITTNHAPALNCNHEAPILAHTTGAGFWQHGPGTLRGREQDSHENLVISSSVRRLTPRECERLQGFPDDWTMIPWRGKPAKSCPDGPRYKACGNSMAVPVMRWIGERIKNIS